jgi:serine-type D-Ala-D-Ala carboxypeptidase/endopeptidase
VNLNSAKLEKAVLDLGKKKHVDPAIIFFTPDGKETIGPIESRWEIGSITKVFTSVLLAQLAQTKRISLRETIARHIPSRVVLPNHFDEITFENLATHQSGLPRLPRGMRLFGKEAIIDPYAVFNEDRIFDSISKTKLKSLPEQGRPRYSNYGFGLLGLVLERAVGQKFEELIRDEIILPIGLNSASFGDEGLQQGHSGSQSVSPWHFGRLAGMGGLRMSATDLSKFLIASQDPNHTLAPAFQESLRIRHRSRNSSVGLGWHYLNDESVVGHNGGTLGAMTECWLNLKTGCHVIVFGDGNPGTHKAAIDLIR